MNFKKEKVIFAISGVAGAGKDTLLDFLREKGCAISVSYTDRQAREGEIDGKSYNFISEEEFTKAVENGEFIEWERTRGEIRYGKMKSEFESALNSGKTSVMQIDVLGAQKFKKMGYEIVTIFVIPPSLEEAMNRLKVRNTDTEDQLKIRVERYELEMSYKDKYDHVVVNDDLEKAKQEILDIVEKESKKFEKKKRLTEIVRNSYVILSLFAVIGFGFFQSYQYEKTSITKRLTTLQVEPPKEEVNNVVETPPEEIKKETPVVITPVVKPPSKEVKKKIAASPPKYTPPPQNVVGETKTNSDGSTTTAVSTGGEVNDSDLQKIAQSEVQASTPLDIPYNDETTRFADLKPILLNYMNSVLKWKDEVKELKEIAIRDAGASGWLGVYQGNYIQEADDGKISGSGMIVINTYYIERDYCAGDRDFDGCEGEYAKYILAHEYGHHYTIYHKLVDWGLLPNERFPDSYYNTRPLSKTSTATDYSLGWQNCEAEIIAEDYSYFYSGYGLHRMSGTYGNPSLLTKNWLDNIGSPAPTFTIISPEGGANLAGNITLKIEAASNSAIQNVLFYIGDNLISLPDNKSLEIIIDTTAYANGGYVLKAVVDNGILSTTKEINVTIYNVPPAETPPPTTEIP